MQMVSMEQKVTCFYQSVHKAFEGVACLFRVFLCFAMCSFISMVPTYPCKAGYSQAVQSLHRFCQEGQLYEAFEIVHCMAQQGMQVSKVILACLLRCCIKKNDLVVGRGVHAMILQHEFQLCSKLECQLIRMYALCGSMPEALQVFSCLHEENVYAWTEIISAYVQNGQGEQAVTLYNKMEISSVKPSVYTFIAVLKACVSISSVEKGKLIHIDIVNEGLESDLFIGSALVDMYAKCGGPQEARKVFDKLLVRDVVSWSAMIAGYAQHGYGWEALRLFEAMQQECIKPNKVTFVCLLKSCVTITALNQGKLIHAEISKEGHEVDIFVGSTLIDMYVKCGSLEDARKVYDKLSVQSVVSWNAMISGYTDHRNAQEALHLFRKMQQEGTKPDRVTYACILKFFATTGALEHGKMIHDDIERQEMESDLVVGSALVDMYAKCGSLENAWKVFHNLAQQDVVSWSVMMSAYAEHGFGEEALDLYKKMQQKGIKPDKITFVCILKACASIASLDQSKLIHNDITKRGLESDIIVGSTLVDMYAKCGSLEDALTAFDNLPVLNVVSWNVMIGGYLEHGFGQKAFELFVIMLGEGTQPDEVTFLCLLKAFSGLAALDNGKWVHDELVKKGFELSLATSNTLVDMYAKCGSLEDAHQVFDNLSLRTVVSWSALIAGYAENGDLQEAFRMYQNMRNFGLQPNEVTFVCILKACDTKAALDEGMLIHADIVEQGLEGDVCVGNSVVDMYAKCGRLEEACRVFEKLLVRNVVSWSALIAGYTQYGFGEEALQLFEKMQDEGANPNEVTYVCAIKACSSIAALDQGMQIHAGIIERRLDSVVSVGNTLIDMYAKCGSLEDASKVFHKLPLQDMISWNAMIAGYADHGYCMAAQQYFEWMQHKGLKPDGVTFVSLLSACSHAGLVQEGHLYFKSMSEEFGLIPTMEHYVSMVDTLGRAGHLNDAEDLVLEMPLQPSTVIWMTLLGSCAKSANLELGRRAFDSLVKADSESATGYVLMSNIYAANNMWDKAHKLREMLT